MVTISTSPLVKTYTLQEFWSLPEPADRSKLELIAGVLYMTPPPGILHDRTWSRFVRELAHELDRTRAGGRLYSARAGIQLGNATWLEPDLFWCSDRTEALLGDSPRTTADLVVEVLSPGTREYDRTTKVDTYAALGVPEIWLVDPDSSTVEVCYGDGERIGERRLFHGVELIASRVLPELRVAVSNVFHD